MKDLSMRLSLLAALLSSAALPALAQNAKPAAKPAPPPPAKPAPTAKPPTAAAKPAPPAKPAPAKPAPPRVVKGTDQLAGDVGKLGQPYTLGNDSGSINVTLDSAEFRVTRVVFGNVYVAPQAGEKLLILTYTVQNPNKVELDFGPGSVTFTAVDPQGENHESEESIARVGTTQVPAFALKPAQKLSVYGVIRVPAKGPIPKLMMRRGSDNASLVRYDLRGQVKPLPAPFADPADPTGVTAFQEVPAEPGTVYPVQRWDVKLVSAAFAPGPLGELEPAEGKRFLVVTIEGVNRGPDSCDVGPSTFCARVALADGEKIEFPERLLKATANEDFSNDALPTGAKFTGRLVCEVPKDATIKALLLSEFAANNGRWYRYDAAILK